MLRVSSDTLGRPALAPLRVLQTGRLGTHRITCDKWKTAWALEPLEYNQSKPLLEIDPQPSSSAICRSTLPRRSVRLRGSIASISAVICCKTRISLSTDFPAKGRN